MKAKHTSPILFRASRSTQKSIPIHEVYEDGLMKHGSIYSCAFALQDTNYAATSDEHQADILLRYEEIIKSLSSDVNLKVVLINRLMDEKKLHAAVDLPMRGDRKDGLRQELNQINWERARRGDNISRDRYLILSGEQPGRERAAAWFKRLEENLLRDVNALGTAARRLSGNERLEMLGHLLRPGAAVTPEVPVDSETIRAKRRRRRKARLAGKRGFADRIAPDGMEFHASGDHFRLDARFGRVLMVRDFPANMDDTLLMDVMNMPREMIVALDFRSMTKEKALKIVNGHKDKIEGDIRKRTVTSGKEGNWNAGIPRHLQEQRDNCEYMFDVLNKEDQRLVFAQVVIVHFADSLEQLDLDTAAIRQVGQGKGADIGILRFRQERGLNTALPYGLELVSQRRIVSSENASFLMPFRTREVFEPGGIVYGSNEISKNLIMLNRMAYKNGNGFIVGDAGGGKSVLAKSEMYAVYLATQDDLIIMDPDGEYSRIVEWLGGQVVRISAESEHHINMLDTSRDLAYGDDPIALKCALVSGACDLMMRGDMTGAQRSVLDRCVYGLLARSQRCGYVPTLLDLLAELRSQKEAAAGEIALAMEMYATGSLNTFAKRTNVDIDGRVVCFDIKDLSAHMRDLGMLVVLDEIDRRVARNRKRGRHTWLWCDEIWSLLNYPLTQEFLWSFWKRCRKYGGLPTGITQSLNAIRLSERGLEMLSNSEFVFMMGMSAEDREGAAELFNLSPDQQGYLHRAEPGHGLLRAGNTIIPMDCTINRNSELYRAVTTSLQEVARLDDRERKAQ